MKGTQSITGLSAFVASVLLALPIALAQPGTIMVVAPHPDDEALMASGIIYDQIQAGGAVKVVVVTNGDFYGKGWGYIREAETVKAMGLLGVDEDDVIFLGYPDGRTYEILDAESDTYVVRSNDGKRTETYGNNGLGEKDWHSFVHGTPGKYNRETMREDFRTVIDRFRPEKIFTTSEFDAHPDHAATYSFTRMALQRLVDENPDYGPVLYKTVIHNRLGAVAWPYPGAGAGVDDGFDPVFPMTVPSVAAVSSLATLPLERFPVPEPMLHPDRNQNLKYRVIRTYAIELDAFNFAFCKRDEIFWRDSAIAAATEVNIAPRALLEASSEFVEAEQTKSKAVDGLTYGYPTVEWATRGHGGGASLTLTWDRPHAVERVVLFGRQTPFTVVSRGLLTVVNGSSQLELAVGAIPAGGSIAVPLGGRSITSLTFTIESSVGPNPGLAELQVFSPRPSR